MEYGSSTKAQVMKDTYFSMLKPPTKAHSALNSVTDSARDNTTSSKKAAMAIISSGSSYDSSWDEVYPQLTPIRTLLGSV